jgi:hypothetical protein
MIRHAVRDIELAECRSHTTTAAAAPTTSG